MSTLDHIESIVETTPYMRRQKAELLEDLFTRLQPQRLVEIGTYHGTGTCYLAALAAQYGGHVTTIDLPWTENADHQPQVEQLLCECELTNVTVVRRPDGAEGWFRDYFAAGEQPLDFVYIDGGHTWSAVIAQFAMAYRSLRRGGWLVFDDIQNLKYPEVCQAWHQVVKPLSDHVRTAGNWGFSMRR